MFDWFKRLWRKPAPNKPLFTERDVMSVVLNIRKAKLMRMRAEAVRKKAKRSHIDAQLQEVTTEILRLEGKS